MKERFWLKLTPQKMQFFSDLLSITLGFLLFYYFRFESGLIQKNIEFGFEEIFTINSVLLVYWLVAFWVMGLYKNMYMRSPFDEIWKIIKTLFSGSFFIFFLILIESRDFPRMLFLAYFAFLSITVIAFRFIARTIQKSLRKAKIISYPTIIISKLSSAKEIANQLIKSPSWGMKPIGYVFIDKEEFLKNSIEFIDDNSKVQVCGHIEFLPEIFDQYKPAEIIIADDSTNHEMLLRITSICSQRKIRVKIKPTLYDIFTGQTRTLPVYGIPFIEVNKQLLKPWEEILKRLFDIVFSSLVIILGFPFWLLLAIFIKIESPGSIFYTQERVGKDGKVFKIFKFRSMVPNADKVGGAWTSVNDKRVTKFGRFIRKTHLDEIPQFINVLIGDMSIVGPRPEQTKVVNRLIEVLPYYKRRLLVRPGITGWWQINYGPYVESIEEVQNRLKDDFYYIENMSLKLDIEIVIRTVYCVIKGHGQA